MRRLRTQTLRNVGASVLLALALVLLALSGHHHTSAEAMQSSCAICVVVHHAPAANLALLPRIAPILHSFQLTATDVIAPVHVFRAFKTGRAPPVPPIAGQA